MQRRTMLIVLALLLVSGCNNILGNRTGKARVCTPHSERSCYPGPLGTEGIGDCIGGTQTCDSDGSEWGACVGSIVPMVEDCDNLDRDEDCDGLINESGQSCVCGDGVWSPLAEVMEECDDGNSYHGDDCTVDCRLNKIVAMVGGYAHTCALLSGGGVKCWGLNSCLPNEANCSGLVNGGQLGYGDTLDRGDQPGEMGAFLSAVDLGSGEGAIAIASRWNHTCVVLKNGTIKCWGDNQHGQLGLGDVAGRGGNPGEMGFALPAVDLGVGMKASAIAVGASHTCALLTGGTVKCWGDNGLGQLGLGDTYDRGDEPGEMGNALSVVNLGPGAIVTAITAGHSHTCALLIDGSVRCWGGNAQGQLGLGDISARGNQPGEMGLNLPPVDLGSGEKAMAIAAGHHHTCALLAWGYVKCWGDNFSGALGLGETEDRGNDAQEMGDKLPVVEHGSDATVTAISAGVFSTCALLSDGAIKCWGYNQQGQLGLGDIASRGAVAGDMGDALPRVDLGLNAEVSSISLGRYHACALLAGNRVKCWGSNFKGQLGLGDTNDRGDQPGEMGDTLPFIKLFNDQY